MSPMQMRFLVGFLPFLAFGGLISPVYADLSVDARARLLGGFSPRSPEASGAEAKKITTSPEWEGAARRNSFSALLENDPGLFSPKNQAATRALFAAKLGPAYLNTRNLLYFFAGADALYPNLLFPNFEHVLLVGLENPGVLPDPAALLASGELAGKVGDIGHAFQDVIRSSFFITKNMAGDLRDFGTTTLISVGLAANDFEILAVSPVTLDGQGNMLVEGRGKIHGVRVDFQKPNGQRGDITYLQMDLSDGSRRSYPEFAKYIETKGFQTAYYKAASFLSHSEEFAGLNRFVLSQVSHVVENDDGIPFSFFRAEAGKWDAHLFGIYTNPLPLFGRSAQPDLKSAYDRVICATGSAGEIRLWKRVWSDACSMPANVAGIAGIASVTWNGTLPFRNGYTSVPPGMDDAKNLFSNLIVLDRH